MVHLALRHFLGGVVTFFYQWRSHKLRTSSSLDQSERLYYVYETRKKLYLIFKVSAHKCCKSNSMNFVIVSIFFKICAQFLNWETLFYIIMGILLPTEYPKVMYSWMTIFPVSYICYKNHSFLQPTLFARIFFHRGGGGI